MDYTSSEDDELIEDYVDLEEDVEASDVDQRPEEIQYFEQSENSAEHDLLIGDGDPIMGMEFDSDSSARNFYNAYALRLGFGIRVARSRSERRKGVEVLVMKRFVCLKEGHHKKKVAEAGTKKKRKRLSIRDGCPAMMEVVRRGPERWVITKLVLEHTHVVVSPDKIREIQLSRLSGKEREHETYLRDMRQRVFGEGDAQGLLEYFKEIQAVNSGFFYAMQVDSRNCMTNVVWADVKARLAYNHFGDAVTFDTTYQKNEQMMPVASFTGVNHHGQPVIFGCALIIDMTESSFVWLLETWLEAMHGRHPSTLTTDQGKALGSAVAKVFPSTCHRLCKWRILSRCKKKMPDVYSRFPSFHDELKKCINECDTEDVFEFCWKTILDKYDLRDNTWLQSLYSIRHKWIPAYLRDKFFAELTSTQRLETMNSFFRNNFDMKTSLQVFIAKFEEVIACRYEMEAQDDSATLHADQILKTTSPMERQAAETYTRAVFDVFQAELLEALSHCVVNIQEGHISKYSVERNGNARNRHIVDFNASEKKAACSCYKFEFSGIPCRHMLSVFLVTGIILLPDHYILRRWGRKAKCFVLNERSVEIRSYCLNTSISRYHELFEDAIKCAEKGAKSAEAYKLAKDMLQKAFDEIVQSEQNLAKGWSSTQ